MQDLQEPAKNVSKILVEAGNKYKEICKMMSDINPQFERIDEVMANAKVEYQVDPLCKICSIPMDGFWCSQLCGHIFCKVCLERLHKQPCPTCRTPIGQLLKVHIWCANLFFTYEKWNKHLMQQWYVTVNMNKKQLRELIQSMVMDNYTDEEIRCIMENHFTDFSLKLQDHK